MNEPRRKEKWAYDPQNKGWANDKDKFGQKMLEKMGWTEGSGLGAKGNGTTSHVKVRRKNDALGVGASNKDVDYAWLQTQDNFNSLLKDLNEACGTTDGSIPDGPPPDSVLKDSFKNRERGARLAMFEKRFRKGKDLSLMSSTDLACILGASSKRPERLKSADAQAGTAGAAAAEHEVVEVTGIKTIVHSESVADYFAAKMAARKLRAAEAQPPAPTPPEAEEAGGGGAACDAVVETAAESADEKKAKKKNKKSKKNKSEGKDAETASKKRAHDAQAADDEDSAGGGGATWDESVADADKPKKKKKNKTKTTPDNDATNGDADVPKKHKGDKEKRKKDKKKRKTEGSE